MKKKRTIEDVRKEIEKTRDTLSNLYDEQVELEHKELNLDFEGKYIEYENHVMYVESIMRETLRFSNFPFSYLIRGLGFYSLLTGYSDATDVEWSYWHELYIYESTKSDFDDEIKKIKIITKEEYEKKFDEMILGMVERNKKALEFYENKEENV